MGADGFIAMYGVKANVGSPEEADELEARWKVAARRARLKTWQGRLTDGEPRYFVIGTLLGDFGFEGHDTQLSLTEKELTAMFATTRRRLEEANVEGEPALHLLYEAQC